MFNIRFCIFSLAVLFAPTLTNAEEDNRQIVDLPLMMQQHMLANMRDHLVALTEIQQALSQDEFDQAANIAEKRLGMSSLRTHGGKHRAKYMPAAMRKIGIAMHQAASRFSLAAQEAAVTDDFKAVLGAMSQISLQCVACHTSFRLR